MLAMFQEMIDCIARKERERVREKELERKKTLGVKSRARRRALEEGGGEEESAKGKLKLSYLKESY